MQEYHCKACGKKHYFRGPLCYQCNESLLFMKENQPREEGFMQTLPQTIELKGELHHG